MGVGVLTKDIEDRGPSSGKATLTEHSTEGEGNHIAKKQARTCNGDHP